jgi:recombination protein RecA
MQLVTASIWLTTEQMFGTIYLQGRQEMRLSKKRRRQRKLDVAVATIHHRFGPRALVKGEPASAMGGASAAHISTGFPALDRALGIGGLPKGQMCEIVGPVTSGKTTLALKFLAQVQAGGGQVGYVDQALYFDPDYAHRCGVDLSRLLVGKTHDLGEALAMTEALARNGSLSALVFDALDLLWTDPITESYLAATLSRLPTFLSRFRTILLVLHESPTDNSPALSTLAHTAAVRLQVVRDRWLSNHGGIRGYEARVKVLKNRFGPSGSTVKLEIEFNGTVRGDGL